MYPCNSRGKEFVGGTGKVLAYSAVGCHLHDCSFLCYPLTCSFWLVAILLSLQLCDCWNSGEFFCFVFNSECRGGNCVLFCYAGDIYNSPWRQFEYSFFSCQVDNLQVDFFIFFFPTGKGMLEHSPEAVLYSSSWAKVNLFSDTEVSSKGLSTALCEIRMVLVLSDISSENNFIFKQLLKRFK